MKIEIDFLQALRDGNGYPWLCMNGKNLRKDFLISSLKEFIRIAGSNSVQRNVADSVKENCLTVF